MSQQTPAYVISAATHSAALFRQAFAGPLASAGGVLGSGEYAVTQQASPNMSVLVAAGRSVIPGTQQSPPSGFSFTQQGAYFGFNDGPVTLTLAASSPSNPRIDAIYIAVQDSFYSGSTDAVALGVATGTPSGTPVAPAIPANALLLAYVAVAANATSIVNGNITDKRAFAAVNVPAFVPRGLLSVFTTSANCAASSTTPVALTGIDGHTITVPNSYGTQRAIRFAFHGSMTGSSGGELGRVTITVDGSEVTRWQAQITGAGGPGSVVSGVSEVVTLTPGTHTVGATILLGAGGTMLTVSSGADLSVEDIGIGL